jgi:hypothetical protein
LIEADDCPLLALLSPQQLRLSRHRSHLKCYNLAALPMVGCGESSGAPLALEFPHDFAYEFVTLLAVLDPTAAIPVFLAMTAGLSRKQSLLVATYAVGIAIRPGLRRRAATVTLRRLHGNILAVLAREQSWCRPNAFRRPWRRTARKPGDGSNRRHDSHPVVEGNKTFPCRPMRMWAIYGALSKLLSHATRRVRQALTISLYEIVRCSR